MIKLAPDSRKPTYCSFCGKPDHQVFKLIVGPAPSTICSECVELCNDIIAEAKQKAPAK